MAFGAGQGGVLEGIGCQFIKRLLVATGAQLLALCFRVGNLQRRMDRMTSQAVFYLHGYLGAMGFVTFSTYRLAAMFLGMAGRTLLLRMQTRKIRQGLADCSMAGTALRLQHGGRRQR